MTVALRIGLCRPQTTLAPLPVASLSNYKPLQLLTPRARMTSSESPAAAPWYARYPPPRDDKQPVATVTREAMLEMIKNEDSTIGRDYILVDLRRTDYEGGTIRGSINLPAQSLYPTIPTLYNLFKASKLRNIIWYCCKPDTHLHQCCDRRVLTILQASSRGRGPRAAGWFKDYLNDLGDREMESFVLLEGIAGWARAGGEFVEWMDGYNAAVWAGK